MSDSSETRASEPGAPSDVLMALYMGDRDKARALAAGLTLTLPELATFGDLVLVSERVSQHPVELHDYSGDGWTALHLAGFMGYASVVVRLLRAGADTAARSRNHQGNFALHASIAGRCEMPVITALLGAGADPAAVDAQSYSPIHLASSRGDRGVCELLLACGALRNVRTADGKSPGDIALERGHLDLAEWLTCG